MTNKITSLSEYLQAYKESVADPEGFWAKIAEDYYWHKNGIKFLSGILSDPMLNGFLEVN